MSKRFLTALSSGIPLQKLLALTGRHHLHHDFVFYLEKGMIQAQHPSLLQCLLAQHFGKVSLSSVVAVVSSFQNLAGKICMWREIFFKFSFEEMSQSSRQLSSKPNKFK